LILGNPGGRGQQQGLGEELASEPALRRAQSSAHGELGAALRAARQQQVSDVDARDEKNQQHRAQNREQRGADAVREVALQGMDEDEVGRSAGVVVAFGIGLRKRVENDVELIAGLLAVDACLEPANHAQMMTPLAAVIRQRRVVLQRRPDLGRGAQGIFKRGGHDADDRIERVVEADLFANDRGIRAKAAAP
jgi:hypothetical protein